MFTCLMVFYAPTTNYLHNVYFCCAHPKSIILGTTLVKSESLSHFRKENIAGEKVS